MPSVGGIEGHGSPAALRFRRAPGQVAVDDPERSLDSDGTGIEVDHGPGEGQRLTPAKPDQRIEAPQGSEAVILDVRQKRRELLAVVDRPGGRALRRDLHLPADVGEDQAALLGSAQGRGQGGQYPVSGGQAATLALHLRQEASTCLARSSESRTWPSTGSR